MKYSMKVSLFFLCSSFFISISHAVSTFDFHDNTEVVGKTEIIETVYEDTLIDLARVHNLGFTEIVSANRSVNKWVPGEGTKVVLPKAFIVPSNHLKKGITKNRINSVLKNYYKNDKFVNVAKIDTLLSTNDVINTNNCIISVCGSKSKDKLIILSIIDNLIKGGSGQAVQNMNIAFNFKQNEGLNGKI